MQVWRRWAFWQCCIMCAAAAAAALGSAGTSVEPDDPLSPSCPTKCLCLGTTVECARLRLSSVPMDIASNATVLDLSQNSISTLGDGSFVKYPQLEELNLASNNLVNVSENVFAGLTKLRSLNFNGNNLSAVPCRALLELQELEELYLGDNRIERIFIGDFQGLPELTTLALEGNLIEFIPVEALQVLLNLKILSLAKNKLLNIGEDSFQNLTSLEVLSLASNNIATITSNAFLGLLSLEILELQRNQLHIIPDAIRCLPSLRKLSIAFNHIKYIGDETFRHNSMLAHADLLGNPVSLIESRVFTNLTQLKILIIPEAKELTSFPDLNGTRSMEFLRIERAHLRHVPDDLCHVSYNLKTLDFKSNVLEEVPLLTACTELRQLQLSGNQISSLDGGLFRKQNLLHDLLLGNNQIERIPADAFVGLHKLEILNLVSNRITMIHHDAFLPLKQLNYLNVAENRFPQLPDRGLEHVRQLLAFDNPLLHDFPPPSSLPHVHTLKLAYAYHCCQFATASGSGRRNGLVPTEIQETVFWVPKENVDLSLWATNMSRDLWPVYHNLTHKFGDLAEELWGTMNPDYAYPSNLPQVVEDYLEETRANDYQRVSQVVSCSPQPGPFMPCEDLFDWWTLRCGIWIVFLLAMLGNGAVVFVLVFSRTKMDVPRFLVCNLACADFCMGVYLGFLAVVDASTLGHFKRHALQWQFSVACQMAGFLGVLSSELSVYTLAVITLERNYAITHAMHLNKRLSLKHAAYIMTCGWAFATFTATLPFFGVSDYRKFAVCLPFDIDAPLSLAYVVFLMVINGVAFLILMGCYLKMYCAIRGSQAWNSNDSRIAKRMALLVFTDFICWAPIAFFSLTAAFGLQLVTLEEAKVFTIFVLPLNSCANPFLYAILTKQFKKDCVLICKAIEESRVTRGIGRCRHSSNFSNRQTPANTNSAVVGERHSHNGQVACSCSRGSSDGGGGSQRRAGSATTANASTPDAALAAARRRRRRWRLSKVRFLLCVAAEDVDEPDSACNDYTYAIAEIQKNQQGGKHARHLSVSSDNFSSSRSDSWRQKSIPLRLLDKQGRRGSWTIQRKASQDSNLSSSRNDSSATTPSTSTWRVSRSSVSSDMSASGSAAQRSATATLVNLRDRAATNSVGMSSSSGGGTGVSSPGSPNGDLLPPPTSSVVRFALPQDCKESSSSSPPPPLTSARPKGKLRRQSAIVEDPGSPPPQTTTRAPSAALPEDRPVVFAGCLVEVTKEVPAERDTDRSGRRGSGCDRSTLDRSRHLYASGWPDAQRRHLVDGGLFLPRKLSTISSNSCSLNQDSWGAAMQCLGGSGGHVLQSRVSADESLQRRLEPGLPGPSERCTSLTNVTKSTPPDPRRAWSEASFHCWPTHLPVEGTWPVEPSQEQAQRSQSDHLLHTQRSRTIWEWPARPVGGLAVGEEEEEQEEQAVNLDDSGTRKGLGTDLDPENESLLVDVRPARVKDESDPLVGDQPTVNRPKYLEDDV